MFLTPSFTVMGKQLFLLVVPLSRDFVFPEAQFRAKLAVAAGIGTVFDQKITAFVSPSQTTVVPLALGKWVGTRSDVVLFDVEFIEGGCAGKTSHIKLVTWKWPGT